MLKKFDVQILPRAENELKQITQNIIDAYDDAWAATKVYSKISSKIFGLAIFPNGHPLIGSNIDNKQKIRMTHIDQYNIYFRVNGDSVEILSIRHAHQKP